MCLFGLYLKYLPFDVLIVPRRGTDIPRARATRTSYKGSSPSFSSSRGKETQCLLSVWHPITISPYHHITISPYHHITISPYHHDEWWWALFSFLHFRSFHFLSFHFLEWKKEKKNMFDWHHRVCVCVWFVCLFVFLLQTINACHDILAHNAVIRCLYAYFKEKPAEECPHIDIPLHTLIELIPRAYGCEEKRYALLKRPDQWMRMSFHSMERLLFNYYYFK